MVLLILNIMLITIVIIQEHKNIKSIFLWGLFVLVFGLVGFAVYVLFGNRLKFRAKNLLLEKQRDTKSYIRYCKWFKSYSHDNTNDFGKSQKKFVDYIKREYKIDLWHNNRVKHYFEGESFFNDLIVDLKNAKNNILIEFYIFADDLCGKTISSILKQKSKDGVDVKIIYDAIGSRKTKKRFWKSLEDSGISVVQFFPPVLKLSFLNFKLNYRNHRKIVVIDGHTSYIGGINLRDDHMNKDKNLRPWRDTSVKIEGCASYAVTDVFLNDFVFASREDFDLSRIDNYFPKIKKDGDVNLQIIDGGVEKSQPVILNIYLKIIKESKYYLYIQSPYFIVEDDVLCQIINAKKRGVDVKVIIPKKPDKRVVYSATLKCIKKLIAEGVEIYLYDGFIHSKTLTSENVLSVGSCNFDNRSFFLNFEITSLNYNYDNIIELKKFFFDDLKSSIPLTPWLYKNVYNKYRLPYIIYKLIYKVL